MVGGVAGSRAEQDRKALESFLVGNQDLERLEALLGRFNVFEAIGVVRQELRHSDFLAYLLDPRANHGLGDTFAKQLLQEVVMAAGDFPVPATPLELELWDLHRMEVRREWRNIDVLMLDWDHKLAVVVENKIGSGERPGQLRHYLEVVERHFPGWRILPVYLTPGGDPASHEDYLPIDYGLICGVIDGLAEGRASVLDSDLKAVMSHYTEMLRRHVLGDSETAQLCRQIYRKHKRALDLIYRHRPDPKAETRALLVELIEGTESLVHKGGYKSDYIAFRPKGWEEIPALNAGGSSSGFLRFVFHNHKPGRLDLFLETSPGDEEVRRRLFQAGWKEGSPFNDVRDPATTDHPKLYRRTFLIPAFGEGADDEEREREIRRHWAEFVEMDLPRLEAALQEERWIWEPGEAEEVR